MFVRSLIVCWPGLDDEEEEISENETPKVKKKKKAKKSRESKSSKRRSRREVKTFLPCTYVCEQFGPQSADLPSLLHVAGAAHQLPGAHGHWRH